MAQAEEIKIRNDQVGWEPRPTLGSADYASAEVWEEERERIWWGDWVCAGRTEEVANVGDYIVRDIAGESVFVTRNGDGELRAFYNVCAHRGTKFLDDIDGTATVRKAFVCPYHAWTFDLNGRLIGTPNVKEDEHFDRADHPLYDVAVDSHAGFLFLNLTSGGPKQSLTASLTDGAETITAFERFKMDELRVGIRIVYEVAANWKIVVENYNECLHCPQIHPELVQVVPLFRFGEVWDEEIPDDGNRMTEGTTSFTMSGASQLPKLPGLEPDDYEMYYGTYQFPNLMLNLHPDCGMYYLGYPKGPNHTTVVSEYLFRPETIAGPDFKPEPVVELWDLISKQDWKVCERAQRGVSSRAFTRGVYPRQDRFLYWFNEEWRRAMGRPTLG
jgi:Rieske 2Fe-2S family protein